MKDTEMKSDDAENGNCPQTVDVGAILQRPMGKRGISHASKLPATLDDEHPGMPGV
jgi:hypothetical protein